MKTAQEVYDKTLFHLRNQGVASVGEYFSNPSNSIKKGCAYRGENGTSCAVGCHIPDELYDPKIEGLRFYDLPTELRRCLGLEKHSELLSHLQYLHDTMIADHFDEWEKCMKKLADKHGLIYTPPKEV